MKYIIEENGQIIIPRGRKFYYPPWDKWIDDKYLDKYSPAKLADRFGIYQFVEVLFDRDFYKPIGWADVKDGYVITRTYELEPKTTPAQCAARKLRQYKQEGIRLYAKAVRVEPLLELTGDTMDLVVYKESLRGAFVAARGELRAILDDTTIEPFDKCQLLRQHVIEWPLPPVDEETWEDYKYA